MTRLEIIKKRLELDNSDVRWLLDKLEDAIELIQYWEPGKKHDPAGIIPPYAWEESAKEFIESVYGDGK